MCCSKRNITFTRNVLVKQFMFYWIYKQWENIYFHIKTITSLLAAGVALPDLLLCLFLRISEMFLNLGFPYDSSDFSLSLRILEHGNMFLEFN